MTAIMIALVIPGTFASVPAVIAARSSGSSDAGKPDLNATPPVTVKKGLEHSEANKERSENRESNAHAFRTWGQRNQREDESDHSERRDGEPILSTPEETNHAASADPT